MKPSQLIIAAEHLIKQRRPGMIWGAPGVGKSDILRLIAKNLGYELRDVRLSTMDVVDVRGFPVPDLEQQVMKWLTANFLPPMLIKGKPNKTKGVIFLDELTSAVPAVQAAMYQLILDFRIGDYVLPEGWAIMATGNRKTDRSVVHEMPSALANRLIHLDVEADPDDWQDWARSNNISSTTRGFLAFRKDLLHKFDPNARSWPSGRTWEFVDRNVRDKKLPHEIEYALTAGAVGEGPAAEYLAYAEMADSLPTADEILKKPDTVKISDEPNVLYAIATMMDTQITPQTLKPAMTFLQRLPKEFQVLTMRGAVKACPELETCEEVTAWLMSNTKLLTG